jgi:hypothetical protein
MNTITLQFVIPKRMHSRAGSPGKLWLILQWKWIIVVLFQICHSIARMEEVEGEREDGTAQEGGAVRWSRRCFVQCKLHTAICTLQTVHFTLHTAHFTLHSSHCTLQGTCPSQTTWSPYCWLLSHSCMRTWESSCCFSRYTLHSTLIPPQAPQP